MKTLSLLIVFFTASNTYASFNRLWVGHKKQDISTAHFLNGLNKTFFQETIQVGQGRGLLSYQPYVTSMGNDVPDEFALVIYESEDKYKAIRSTPEGERYSASHWDYFDKSTSKSTVSRPFKGELIEGNAYELNDGFKEWQSFFTTVTIYSRTNDTDLSQLAKAFGELKSEGDLGNSILLITSQWIIEYRSMKAAKSAIKWLPLNKIEHTLLQNSSLSTLKNTIAFKEGVNFKF